MSSSDPKKRRSTTTTSLYTRESDTNGSSSEVNPLKSTLTIPENKTSVWVYQQPLQQQYPLSKEPAAVWSTGTFILERTMTREQRQQPMELWTFFEDDPLGVEESVLRNNPQQGLWGYDASVRCRQGLIRPLKSQLPLRPDQMVIVPPEGDIPDGLQVAGIWIRPQYKRDVSALADGTIGFLQVSGSLERYEKHSIGGAWKMLAFNDVIHETQKPKRQTKPSASENHKPDVLPSSKPSKGKTKSNDSEPVLSMKPTGLDPNKIHVKDPKDKKGKRTISFPFDPTKEWDVPSVLDPIAKKLNRNPRKLQLVQDNDGLPVTPDRPPVPGQVYSLKDLQPEEVRISVPSKGRNFALLVDPNTDSLPEILKKAKKQAGILPIHPFSLIPDESDNAKSNPSKRCFVLIPEEPIESDRPNDNHETMRTAPSSKLPLIGPLIQIQAPNKSRVFALYIDQEPPSPKTIAKRPKDAISMLPTNTPNDVNDAIAKRGEPNGRVFFFDPDGHQLDDDEPLSNANKDPEQEPLRMERIPTAIIQTPNKSRCFHLFIDPEPPSPETLARRPKTALSMLPSQTPYDVHEEIAKRGEPNGRVFFLDPEGNQLDDDEPLSLADQRPNQVLNWDTTPKEILPSAIIETPNKSRTFALFIDPEPPSREDLAKRPKDSLSMLMSNTPNDVNAAIGERNARVFFLDPDGNLLDDDIPLSHADLDCDRVLHMEQLPNALIETPCKSRAFALYIDPEPPSPKSLAKRPQDSLSMLPNNTPNDVNEAIEAIMGKRNARVFFTDGDGDILADDAPLKGAVLDFDDLLRMERLPETLIETPSRSRTFALYIDPEPPSPQTRAKRPKQSLSMLSTNTPNDVNNALAELGEQNARVFFLDVDGSPLGDDDPLSCANLDLDRILRMEPIDDNTLTFRSNDGRSFFFDIAPDDTIRDVKKKLREKSNLEMGAFRLGDLDFDDVDEEELIRDHVRPGVILTAEPPKVEIRVPGTSEKIRMAILPTTTMREVEKIVEEKLYNGEKKGPRVFLYDADENFDFETPILKKIDFEKGWQLEVRDFELQVVHWDGRQVTLTVQTTEYIGDLKDKIAKSALAMPVDQQNLTFQGQPVDESSTLKTQNITHGSLLKLEPMKIYLAPPSGKKIAFLVKLSTSILSVKTKACKKTNIPVEVMCLMSGSTEFTDAKTLRECNVMHKDTIQIEIFCLNIMDIHGVTTSMVDLKPSDSIKTLRKRIEKYTEVPKAKQVLKLESRVINNDGTLISQGIKHRSVVTVVDSTKVDLSLPTSEQRKLKTMKTKKFKAVADDIWPVVPDWKNRIFFFDIDDSLDSSLVDVTLMHWTGDVLSITKVKLGWTLDELKNHILKHHKISAKKEKVFFSGKELDPKRTLRQQGIQHRSILVMQSKNQSKQDLPGMEKLDFMAGLAALPTFFTDSINVKIRHWKGQEFVVKVQPSDYLDDVKDLIFEQKKIAVDHQRVTYNGASVDETERLGTQGITDGCVLQLEPMKITIIQSSSGKEISLVVESDDMIRDVKKQVYNRIKVPIELQCIVFGGEELPDSKTLDECAVEHQETLQMEEFVLSVVHWLGDVFRLSGLRPDSTINEVKSEILRVRYVPKKVQRLIFKGVTLQNSKTLADESIRHKSVLVLEEQPEADTTAQPRRLFNFMASLETTPSFASAMKVTVMQSSTGSSFSVGVDSKDYADDLRERIQRDHRIPVQEQRFSLGGTPIRDDESLGAQGIVDGSILQLDPMRVILEMPSGDQVSLDVEKDWTIRYVKQKAIKGPSSDDFCIMFGGKELLDRESLEEYDIEHNSILFLEVFKISVVDATGASPMKIPNVRRTSTVASVKQSIAALQSIPVGRQQLSFQGKELSDKKTLADHCIHHKSILVLEEAETMFQTDPVRTKIIFSTGNGPKAMNMKLATKVTDKPVGVGDDDCHSDSDSSVKRLDAVLEKIRRNGDFANKQSPKVPVVTTTKSPKTMATNAKPSRSAKKNTKSSKSRPSESPPKGVKGNDSSQNANLSQKGSTNKISSKTEKSMTKS